VDVTPSAQTVELQAELTDFLHTRVLPAEAVLEEQLASSDDPLRFEPPLKEELKAEARSRGRWNLFLAGGSLHGAGLTNLEYTRSPRPWAGARTFP